MCIVNSLRFSGFIIYPLPAVPLTTCDFKKHSNLTFQQRTNKIIGFCFVKIYKRSKVFDIRMKRFKD